jgi:hypothetical protein
METIAAKFPVAQQPLDRVVEREGDGLHTHVEWPGQLGQGGFAGARAASPDSAKSAARPIRNEEAPLAEPQLE